MKTLILTVALLGTFLTQALADDDVNVSNQGNDGGDVHQTVTIDNHEDIININYNDGFKSWNSVCDYTKGLFATRFISKEGCVVSRMNKAVFPSLAQLSRVAHEKEAPIVSLASQHLAYTVASEKVSDVAGYGPHIEALCRGIPTYQAEEMQGGYGFADCKGCRIVTILGINMCF